MIYFLIFFNSGNPVIHWSKRVGKYNKFFLMPKFRTMKNSTPDVATHLIKDPNKYIDNFGKILRKLSLDELPQLYSVLKGDMSLVGPRPALHNQKDLIALRTKKKISNFLPGITGLAQINGRDELSILKKIDLDEIYCNKSSLIFDIKILILTLIKIFNLKKIKH